MFFNKTAEDAVSPVVGVILMVAVTVILAAVIGSFVLDLGSNVSANPSAGVTFDQDATNDEVDVQVISMENADKATLDASNPDGSATAPSVAYNTGSELDGVGQTATVSDLTDGDKITVIGHLDGKQAVLQTFEYSP